jgi:methylase of polypeptide subunit release factors
MQLLLHYIFFEGGIDPAQSSGYRFFDAGCGSGQRVLGMAKEFPGASFTGVDLCEHSLSIAKAQPKKHNINNITFRQANLTDFLLSLYQ